MKAAIIGGGVMGEAMLAAALRNAVFDPATTTVCEPVAARRDDLASRFKVSVTATASDAVAGADAVVLAVKPQELTKVSATVERGALLLSIMAGVRVETLSQHFSHDRVVRVMPNTPAAVGAGMSAWVATPEVTADQRVFARALLGSFGREVEVDDEKKLDMVTALSGSGPAYVFLFVEALVEGGVSVGLPRALAEELALQTVFGSAKYAMEAGTSPGDLRAAVTSPAGTTAAGLLELEKGAFRATVIECVRAAHRRAVELGTTS